MGKITAKDVGKGVILLIADHGLNVRQAVDCLVMGIVYSVDEANVMLAYWHCTNVADNDEFLTIVHSAIKQKKAWVLPKWAPVTFGR